MDNFYKCMIGNAVKLHCNHLLLLNKNLFLGIINSFRGCNHTTCR